MQYIAAMPQWLVQFAATAAAGAVGALVMFWLTRRQQISQHWWQKQFEIHAETALLLQDLAERITTLNQLCLQPDARPRREDLQAAYTDYETAANKLRRMEGYFDLAFSQEAHDLLLEILDFCQDSFPTLNELAAQPRSEDVCRRIYEAGNINTNLNPLFVRQARKDLGLRRSVFQWIRRRKRI